MADEPEAIFPDQGFPSSPPMLAASSPLVLPASAPLSPTSSVPAVFSSDDPCEGDEISNYKAPRNKRKRAGHWWDEEEDPKTSAKKRELARNFDSGVYMEAIDGAYNSPVQSKKDFEQRLNHRTQTMDQEQVVFFSKLICVIEEGNTQFNFEGRGLEDADLQHLRLLQQVIGPVPDPGNEVPAEGQYRSLVPEIVLQLGNNNLKLLSPQLFAIEHLTFLSLRFNNIEELPPQIANLQSLQTLDLSSNRLSTLPRDILTLFEFGSLERLYVSGNPLLTTSKFIAHCESVVPFKADWVTQRQIGISPIFYFDKLGRPLKGFPRAPQIYHRPSNSSGASILDRPLDESDFLPTKGDAGKEQSPFTKPHRRTNAPSLWTLAFNKTIQQASPAEIEELLGHDIPLAIEHGLAHAKENIRKTYSAFKTCRCDKQFVIPRAVYFEFWVTGPSEVIPIKFEACSWVCAEEFRAVRLCALRRKEAPKLAPRI